MTRRNEKRLHMLMWAMLTHPSELSWLFLLQWAALDARGVKGEKL